MVMDALLILIFLLCAGHYWRRGFAMTVLSLLQWFLCIVLGLLATGKVRDFLRDDTPAGEELHNYFVDKLADGIENSQLVQTVPKLFESWIKNAEEYVTDTVSEGITNMVLAIAAFVIIVIAIRIVCWLLARIFSKKYRSGAQGFIDGLLGLVIGGAIGAIACLLFLAALATLMPLLPEGMSAAITSSFESSLFSGNLYDENFLLKLVRDLFA